MSTRLRKKSSKNKTRKNKEPKVKMYYPYKKIGEGAYKQVFNVVLFQNQLTSKTIY